MKSVDRLSHSNCVLSTPLYSYITIKLIQPCLTKKHVCDKLCFMEKLKCVTYFKLCLVEKLRCVTCIKLCLVEKLKCVTYIMLCLMKKLMCVLHQAVS